MIVGPAHPVMGKVQGSAPRNVQGSARPNVQGSARLGDLTASVMGNARLLRIVTRSTSVPSGSLMMPHRFPRV